MALGWHRPTDEKRDLARLRVLLLDGYHDDAIAKAFGWSPEELKFALVRFYDREADLLRGKSSEQVYAEYVVDQLRNMRTLELIVEEVVSDILRA